LIENPEHNIYISIASIWEMAIKVSLEKLQLSLPYNKFIDTQLETNVLKLLDVQIHHAALIASLPFYHRDPFDRMIIAQSQSELIPIIGKDEVFDRYNVIRHW
jgi:PIN domain nuclease of toxin-antitoxin system